MKLARFCVTILHLTPEQILFQIIRHIHTPKFIPTAYAGNVGFDHLTDPISKTASLNNGEFTFLNQSHKFQGWEDDHFGPLWTYNLNYMDWLQQPEITPDECAFWIDRFIEDTRCNKIGFAPYPTALRCINWIKFFCDNNRYATSERLSHLFSQLQLLSKSIEYNIGANHLLEDTFALTIGAACFKDKKMARNAARLLKRELNRQILPDGAHYEQSPMYHCILSDRILDCINYIGNGNPDLFKTDTMECLIKNAKAMIGHLKSIVWDDGTIPLLNDSAYGIAPQPSELLDYAIRLGLDSAPIAMKECGYRRLANNRINVIADVGNITAKNQPGHTHADTLSYEMRIDNKPFIIDTGISTYNKNDRRQYERGTKAHNTVSVDGKDSSQVWSGFRVASRAKVTIKEDKCHRLVACHDGFGKHSIHTRCFSLDDNIFSIDDICNTQKNTVSRIHFAPGVKILSADNSRIVTDKATICIEGSVQVMINDVESSVEYNDTKKCKVAEISFKNHLTYSLHINP